MPRKRSIPDRLRAQVAEQARYRCGYCLSTEVLMGAPMTTDHIVPEAVGGPLEADNLWLACSRCNTFKAAQVQARDSETDRLVNLFNPRDDDWREHFRWSEDGTHVVGRTACGRATIAALQLNNSYIIVTRREWVAAGWWPPQD